MLTNDSSKPYKDRNGNVAQFGKIAGFIVLAFALFAIFTNPQQAAGFVESIFVGLANGLKAIGTFFSEIMAPSSS